MCIKIIAQSNYFELKDSDGTTCFEFFGDK